MRAPFGCALQRSGWNWRSGNVVEANNSLAYLTGSEPKESDKINAPKHYKVERSDLSAEERKAAPRMRSGCRSPLMHERSHSEQYEPAYLTGLAGVAFDRETTPRASSGCKGWSIWQGIKES